MSKIIEELRKELETATTKVPYEIQNGSIQITREWMNPQKKAVKLLSKKTATQSELMLAISSLSISNLLFQKDKT